VPLLADDALRFHLLDDTRRAVIAYTELALNPDARANYPFMRLTGDANVLVMPAIHSAAISTRLVQSLGAATVIGPLLVGLEKSVQIVPLGASVSEIITSATFAAYSGAGIEE